eukprot:6188449-Pleurochrysis_carterae.AAC.4
MGKEVEGKGRQKQLERDDQYEEVRLRNQLLPQGLSRPRSRPRSRSRSRSRPPSHFSSRSRSRAHAPRCRTPSLAPVLALAPATSLSRSLALFFSRTLRARSRLLSLSLCSARQLLSDALELLPPSGASRPDGALRLLELLAFGLACARKASQL